MPKPRLRAERSGNVCRPPPVSRKFANIFVDCVTVRCNSSSYSTEVGLLRQVHEEYADDAHPAALFFCAFVSTCPCRNSTCFVRRPSRARCMQCREGEARDAHRSQQVPATSVNVSLAGGPAIAPGQKAGLVATLTKPDGTTLVTEGKGGGKVMWKDLQVAPAVVKADTKGNVSLAKDPRVSERISHCLVVRRVGRPRWTWRHRRTRR
jgi:hypothetical protein